MQQTTPPTGDRAVDQDVAAPPRDVTPDSPAPVTASDRISSLDILRGLALMGILLMNIVAMGLYTSAYEIPTAHGGATGLNLAAFVIADIVADGKMRGIFSLLFGAGVILLTSRLEARGFAGRAADIYYRRTIWLMFFGIAHAFLLYMGDILYPYALMGFLLFPLRNWSPRGLIILASVLALGTTLLFVVGGFALAELQSEAQRAEAVIAAGGEPDEDLAEARDSWQEQLEFWSPPPDELQDTVEAQSAGYFSMVVARAPEVWHWHAKPFWFPIYWDMLFMMLLGMAFFKMGILSGERTASFYGWMMVAGYGIGLPLAVVMVRHQVNSDFEVTAMLDSLILYEPARVGVCLGHLALAMLIIQAGLLGPLAAPLAAVGRMALSNYVLHSVLAVLFFNVAGYFGALQRYQLYYVVAVFWIINLTWSPLWLRRYRFGPLEWLWRSLTYWQLQPLRR